MIKKTKLHLRKTTKRLKGLSKMKRTMKRGGAQNILNRLINPNLRLNYESFLKEYGDKMGELETLNKSKSVKKKITHIERAEITSHTETTLTKLNKLSEKLDNKLTTLQLNEEITEIQEHLNHLINKLKNFKDYTFIPDEKANDVKDFKNLLNEYKKVIDYKIILDLITGQYELLQYIEGIINIIIKPKKKKPFNVVEYVKTGLYILIPDLGEYQELLAEINKIEKSQHRAQNKYTRIQNKPFINSTPRHSNGTYASPQNATNSPSQSKILEMLRKKALPRVNMDPDYEHLNLNNLNKNGYQIPSTSSSIHGLENTESLYASIPNLYAVQYTNKTPPELPPRPANLGKRSIKKNATATESPYNNRTTLITKHKYDNGQSANSTVI
jgi:hypothetical protein